MAKYKNKWLVSYETLLFNTPDGDLGTDQYALDGEGKGYYIRTIPKNAGQFEHVELSYDVSKLVLVKIIPGHAHYDEFLTADGAKAIWRDKIKLPIDGKVRIKSSTKKYNSLRTVKNAPQPKRTESVGELPPDEPLQEKSTHNSIGFDAASASIAIGAVSSYSFNHTCGGGADLLVFGDSHLAVTDRTVDVVTFNTDPLTVVRSDVQGGKSRATIYYMVAPDTGSAYSVAVTYSGNSTYGCGGVVSYSGAKQTGQPDAHNGATGGAGNATVDVTTSADNCWVFSVIQGNGLLTGDNTERWDVVQFGTISGGGSDTNAVKTPAGAQTMSWTIGVSDDWALAGASFAPLTGWASGDVSGVAIAGIAKINGIALASITKVNGIS